MHNSESIIQLLKGVQETMNLVNENMTEAVKDRMTSEQLALLDEARKASSKEELKNMTNRLVSLNQQMRNYAT